MRSVSTSSDTSPSPWDAFLRVCCDNQNKQPILTSATIGKGATCFSLVTIHCSSLVTTLGTTGRPLQKTNATLVYHWTPLSKEVCHVGVKCHEDPACYNCPGARKNLEAGLQKRSNHSSCCGWGWGEAGGSRVAMSPPKKLANAFQCTLARQAALAERSGANFLASTCWFNMLVQPPAGSWGPAGRSSRILEVQRRQLLCGSGRFVQGALKDHAATSQNNLWEAPQATDVQHLLVGRLRIKTCPSLCGATCNPSFCQLLK